MKPVLEGRLPEKLIGFFKQYKIVLILIAAGALLLMLTQEKGQVDTSASAGMTGTEEIFSVNELEDRLSRILSQVEGAGEVSVMLTVRSGMERILATDQELSEQEYEREAQRKTVVISGDNGEEVVLIGQNYPIFQGALVVCRGGGDPAVQLQLTKAVSALTGLSSNKITVCKGS